MTDNDLQLELEIFVSDREARESISEVFADGESSAISVLGVEQKRVFGSFDLPFCVGVALSIPLGIVTGIVANWLTERLRKAREKGVHSTIKIQVEGYTVIIPAGQPAMIGPVIKALEEATKQRAAKARR